MPGRVRALGGLGGHVGAHQFITTRGGLAEATHGVRRQRRVGLVQPQVDLAIGEREQAAPGAIAFDEKRAEPLDFQDPHRLGDPELREPVDLAYAADASAMARSSAARLLADYRAKYPDGDLQEEALALSIEAAVARHDPAAPSFAAEYLKRYPNGRFHGQAERALQSTAR